MLEDIFKKTSPVESIKMASIVMVGSSFLTILGIILGWSLVNSYDLIEVVIALVLIAGMYYRKSCTCAVLLSVLWIVGKMTAFSKLLSMGSNNLSGTSVIVALVIGACLLRAVIATFLLRARKLKDKGQL